MARAKAVLESVTTESPRRAPAGKGASRRERKDRRDRRTSSRVQAAPRYERKYRQTVRRIDLWSVLKISVCFYLTALIVVLVAGIVLWWIASAAGIIGNVEDFFGDLVYSDDFKFLSWEVLRASTLVGLVIVSLAVVITVLAAAFYNLFSELLGGIEITVVEEENLG